MQVKTSRGFHRDQRDTHFTCSPCAYRPQRSLGIDGHHGWPRGLCCCCGFERHCV